MITYKLSMPRKPKGEHLTLARIIVFLVAYGFIDPPLELGLERQMLQCVNF